MTWDIGSLIVGLILLFLGGEALVRGSVAIAERLQISKLIIGMVIVGFGTSAPELLVSVQAALAGSPDIAIGNIIGSNIANVLLIIGLAAVIAPIANNDKALRRDVLVMVAASVGLFAVLLFGEISRTAGVAMITAFFIYLAVTYRLESRRRASVYIEEAKEVAELRLSPVLASGSVAIGLAFLIVGAKLMVEGATAIALSFGISEAVIGLTIVAVGTSLPELATALVAAWRQHAEIVLANIVGSNIFNILGILGITAAIAPIGVASKFMLVDAPVMVAVAFVTIGIIFFVTRVGRRWGFGLLAAYAGYLVVQL
jgi:cation:H+ antiporter